MPAAALSARVGGPPWSSSIATVCWSTASRSRPRSRRRSSTRAGFADDAGDGRALLRRPAADRHVRRHRGRDARSCRPISRRARRRDAAAAPRRAARRPRTSSYALTWLRGPKCVASSSPLDRIRVSLETTGLMRFFEPYLFSASDVPTASRRPICSCMPRPRCGSSRRLHRGRGFAGRRRRGRSAAGMTPIGFIGGSHADSELGAQLTAAGARTVDRRHARARRARSSRCAAGSSFPQPKPVLTVVCRFFGLAFGAGLLLRARLVGSDRSRHRPRSTRCRRPAATGTRDLRSTWENSTLLSSGGDGHRNAVELGRDGLRIGSSRARPRSAAARRPCRAPPRPKDDAALHADLDRIVLSGQQRHSRAVVVDGNLVAQIRRASARPDWQSSQRRGAGAHLHGRAFEIWPASAAGAPERPTRWRWTPAEVNQSGIDWHRHRRHEGSDEQPAQERRSARPSAVHQRPRGQSEPRTSTPQMPPRIRSAMANAK